MPDLITMLKDADAVVLSTISETWGVRDDIRGVPRGEVPGVLHQAMRQPARAESVYDRLSDQQRGVLQALASQKDQRMTLTMFSRLYGPVTLMGQGQVDKQKPHLTSESAAEVLFYRGLIGIEKVSQKGHIQEVVYVPSDLLAVLPMHRTAYDNLEGEPDTLSAAGDDDNEADIITLSDSDVSDVQPADTSIVDDMTTFLAFLRVYGAAVEGDDLLPADAERLLPFLIGQENGRTSFLLCVGYTAGLLDVREGRAYVQRDGLQKWFALPRWGQVKLLADAWRDSTYYIDLFHVPTLYPDPQGFDYDPVVARRAIIDHIARLTPARAWWEVESFVDVIRESDPDFQRPDGNYDTWYLRDAQNRYLRGIESWDSVEGALIPFLIHRPMHWLGLVDTSSAAARLNAYGRAFVGLEAFPQPADPDERIQLHEDGTALASRKVSRLERFTLARMAQWVADAPHFTYRIDTRSLERALREQNITLGQIESFLRKQSEPKPVPPGVLRMLQVAQQGPLAQVTFERALIMQTLSEDMMQHLFDEPGYRRYLGRRLGPVACMVLPEGADALRQTLEQNGIRVEWVG